MGSGTRSMGFCAGRYKGLGKWKISLGRSHIYIKTFDGPSYLAYMVFAVDVINDDWVRIRSMWFALGAPRRL